MSILELLPSEGTFYKANLHTHSTYSDGHLTPLQLKERYQAEGYSILAYTDHNILLHHQELTDETFLALCGYELNSPTMKTAGGIEKVCHRCV